MLGSMLKMERIYCHDGIILPYCICWATIDANGGEESGGAKGTFDNEDVMLYLKARETKATWSSKERD